MKRFTVMAQLETPEAESQKFGQPERAVKVRGHEAGSMPGSSPSRARAKVAQSFGAARVAAMRILLAFLVGLVLMLPSDGGRAAAETTPLIIETAAGLNLAFQVELARTEAEREQGLMYRDKLAADAGMLFIYPTERPVAFWMKNTLIPLDMLFIKRDGTILMIAERTIPLSEATVPSGGPVTAVLEINGGVASHLGIRPGDRVECEALRSPNE
jgi:uncharacterized membrane protein (UPF0127 family)